MYISSFLAVSSLAALSLVAADSSTYSYVATTASVCGAQPVLEACIGSTTAIIESCASTDYSCLCQKYSDLVTYVAPILTFIHPTNLITTVASTSAPTMLVSPLPNPPKRHTAPTPRNTLPQQAVPFPALYPLSLLRPRVQALVPVP